MNGPNPIAIPGPHMLSAVLTLLYAFGLLVLGLFAIRTLGLTAAWLAVRRRRPDRVPAPPAGEWPFVTVQLPLYNERTVAARVIHAACRLDWPADRLEIQVLDDSTDDTRAIVDAAVRAGRARGVDVAAVRRADRAGYKAGALANGLARARGTALAVFDADFVPAPDFLKQTVPHLAPGVAVVQARWGHLNRDGSWLTRAQALGLDGYFVIQQTALSRCGLFLNFNGTAGVWQREAIRAAGGWQADTLTEDVDLSYRAQMAGWRIVVLPDVVAPAELPATMHAFRRQQQRWTKGTIQTLLKLGPRLLRADRPLYARLQAVVNLSGYFTHPITLGMLLGGPLLIFHPPHLPPALALLALVPLCPLCMYAAAQAAIEPRWLRRLAAYPVLLGLSIGMSWAGTVAVLEALAGRCGAFERTPKTGAGTAGVDVGDVRVGGGIGDVGVGAGIGDVRVGGGDVANNVRVPAIEPTTWIEIALAAYAWLCALLAMVHGSPGLVAAFALYGFGFTLTAGLALGDTWAVVARLRAVPGE